MEKPVSRAIVIEGGYGNKVHGNTIVGFDEGIVGKNTSGLSVQRNQVIGAGAVALFNDIIDVIEKSELPSESKESLHGAVNGMALEFGKPGYVSMYKHFMSVLADHMQVLGPTIAVYLPQLAKFLGQ